MRTRIAHLWDVLSSSYWFVPSLMTAAAIVLALTLVHLDRSLKQERLEKLDFIYLGGPEGARALLSTVAASVITVAGVVFSITIAALTQASSQFGPRLLRNFMRDTGNQVVLGTFVATFIYCVLVLRTVYGMEDRSFVPHVSVTVAVALAVASLGVLIYFVHHVSWSLQAPVVAANVARELREVIEALYGGDDTGADDEEAGASLAPGGARASVRARQTGYLLAIDVDQLVADAAASETVVRMRVRPGHFLSAGRVVADVESSSSSSSAASSAASSKGNDVNDLADSIDAALVVGDSRTSEQDVEFGIDQLVEVAVRALSPGINDPFTAMHCVDWLGDALVEIARRPAPSRLCRDGEGRVRVILDHWTFDGLADAAFNQIRQHARDNVAVTVRLLEAVINVARCARSDGQRRALRRHAEMVRAQAAARVAEPNDRQSVEGRYAQAIELLSAVGGM